jgi:hypothetical protein
MSAHGWQTEEAKNPAASFIVYEQKEKNETASSPILAATTKHDKLDVDVCNWWNWYSW